MLTDYKNEHRHKTAREQVLEAYQDIEWKGWQQEILDKIDTEADGRTVNWYHEYGKPLRLSFISTN